MTIDASVDDLAIVRRVSTKGEKDLQTLLRNIVSAYHRDSIFVPSARAEEALALLKKLAASPAPRR